MRRGLLGTTGFLTTGVTNTTTTATTTTATRSFACATGPRLTFLRSHCLPDAGKSDSNSRMDHQRHQSRTKKQRVGGANASQGKSNATVSGMRAGNQRRQQRQSQQESAHVPSYPLGKNASLQIFGNGSAGRGFAWMLQVGGHRVLFNVGDGCMLRQVPRIDNVLVTRLSAATVGGLPGLVITRSEGGSNATAFHGPPRLVDHILSYRDTIDRSANHAISVRSPPQVAPLSPTVGVPSTQPSVSGMTLSCGTTVVSVFVPHPDPENATAAAAAESMAAPRVPLWQTGPDHLAGILPEGQVHSVVGYEVSGVETLFRCMEVFVPPRRPSASKARSAGGDTASRSACERRHNLCLTHGWHDISETCRALAVVDDLVRAAADGDRTCDVKNNVAGATAEEGTKAGERREIASDAAAATAPTGCDDGTARADIGSSTDARDDTDEDAPAPSLEQSPPPIAADGFDSRAEGIVVYVCYLKQEQGRLNAARAKELGVPMGPLRKSLVDGRRVKLEDGRWIEPHQVVDAPPPRRAVAVVDCPDPVYIDGLVTHDFWSKTADAARGIPTDDRQIASSTVAMLVAHASPPNVAADPRYRAWMDRSFGQAAEHVFVAEQGEDGADRANIEDTIATAAATTFIRDDVATALAFGDHFVLQASLNLISSSVYPLPFPQAANEVVVGARDVDRNSSQLATHGRCPPTANLLQRDLWQNMTDKQRASVIRARRVIGDADLCPDEGFSTSVGGFVEDIQAEISEVSKDLIMQFPLKLAPP